MKSKNNEISLTSLKGVNYLCPNDLYDLAYLSDRLLNTNSDYLSMLTIHGLINNYFMINTSVSTSDLNNFMHDKGFELDQVIVNDQKTKQFIENN